jgi:NAD(P)-dependent dehydrogenase (short-subunit alcohol dehydrogenase family)
VGAADIDRAGVEATVARLRDIGGEAEAIPGDLTAEGIAGGDVDRMVRRWGGIDALVNNAAYGVIEPFLESTRGAWMRTLSINVAALALLSVAAGRVMRASAPGRIVNVTSPGSRMALPDYAAYCAARRRWTRSPAAHQSPSRPTECSSTPLRRG